MRGLNLIWESTTSPTHIWERSPQKNGVFLHLPLVRRCTDMHQMTMMSTGKDRKLLMLTFGEGGGGTVTMSKYFSSPTSSPSPLPSRLFPFPNTQHQTLASPLASGKFIISKLPSYRFHIFSDFSTRNKIQLYRANRMILKSSCFDALWNGVCVNERLRQLVFPRCLGVNRSISLVSHRCVEGR